MKIQTMSTAAVIAMDSCLIVLGMNQGQAIKVPEGYTVRIQPLVSGKGVHTFTLKSGVSKVSFPKGNYVFLVLIDQDFKEYKVVAPGLQHQAIMKVEIGASIEGWLKKFSDAANKIQDDTVLEQFINWIMLYSDPLKKALLTWLAKMPQVDPAQLWEELQIFGEDAKALIPEPTELDLDTEAPASITTS